MPADSATLPGKEASPGAFVPIPGARLSLVLLLSINIFNYIDRQVLAAVEPEIQKTLVPDMPKDEAQGMMGLLSTAFLITYMVIAPLFGWLAGHHSRWILIGIGVILWSLASGASGLDWGVGLAAAFWILLVTRCFVGVGEGAYGPIAPAMIADLYPVKDRGRVLSWFYLAIPVGGALGYAFGERVVEGAKAMGLPEDEWWRWAFFLVVPPGLLLGLLCFLMREPPLGHSDGIVVTPKRNALWRDYKRILSIPSYAINTAGMTTMTFAIGALAYWMPKYLDDMNAPGIESDGTVLVGPRMIFGLITALSGLLATLLGGMAGDWLRPRWSGSYFIVSGIAMVVGFPMLLLFVWTPFPWAWIFMFVAVFCLFFNTGPTNTILANVTHPGLRASGFALNILIIHILGDAISPPIIGYLAGKTSWAFAFQVVSVMILIGGSIWLWGARYLERDTALAGTRSDS